MANYDEKYSFFQGGSGNWYVMNPLKPSMEFSFKGYLFSLEILGIKEQKYRELIKNYGGDFFTKDSMIFYFNERLNASKFCSFMNKEYKKYKIKKYYEKKERLNERK